MIIRLVFATVFALAGIILIYLHRKPAVGNGVSWFLARGQNPPPIVFGPRGVLGVGIVLCVMGAIGFAFQIFVF